MSTKRLSMILASIFLTLVIAVLPFVSSCSSSAPSTTTQNPGNTTSAASDKVTTIKGQSLFPAEDYGYKILANTVIPEINKRLQGQGIQLELYAPDMLVPSGELFDALSKGTLGFTFSDFSFDSQYIPETITAFSLPFAWQTLDQDLAWWDKYGAAQFFTESYAKSNIHFIYPLPEARNVLMTKKEIKSLADLKGLKIWCSPPHDQFIADAGAEATTLSPSEIFMGLQLGTLDGVTYTEPELKTLNFNQVVKYVYHPGIQEVLNVNFNFNQNTWNSFSPDVQNVITNTVKELAPDFYQQYKAAGDEGIQYFQSTGGTVVELSPDLSAQFKQIGRGTWDKIGQTSDRTAQAVKMVKDLMAGENIQ